jgi:hypothetical protein
MNSVDLHQEFTVTQMNYIQRSSGLKYAIHYHLVENVDECMVINNKAMYGICVQGS